jgi:teichuronic acid biosynthesis glycosyltransferase TuaC
MPIIAVVTPLFPLPDEPYRGQPIYETVRAFRRYADVRVFCPITVYPSWSAFARPHLPSRHDLSYSPPDVPATYFSYTALPLINRPWNGEICARSLYPYLEKLRPDLVLNYWVYPEGYAGTKVARRLGIPSIVSSRGSDLRRIEDPLTRRRVSSTLRQANYVLTVSDELRRRAIELGASPKRTAAILNGCDHDTFQLRDRRAARRKLDLAEDQEILLYVGRLAKPKGILDLFAAFTALIAGHPKLRLICVGTGPLQQQMESFVQTHGLRGRIVLTGEHAPMDVAEWMTAADLFCLPSHSEGCPNVLIEAVCCGCPAVATAVGGIPELLRKESGILVPAQEVPGLTAALRDGLTRTWDRTAISGMLVRTWDDVARETHAICEEVLTRAASAKTRPAYNRRMRITVVTPYFPTSEGSYRGHSAFQTLRFLKRWADIHVVCPLTSYPRWKWLTPRTYDPPDLTYKPRGLDATYFQYPAIPIVTRAVNGLICEQYLLPHVRASRPDLILNYWLYPEGFSAVRVGRTLGVPVIVGAIGSDVRRITDPYIRHLVRRTVVEAAGVITVSEELRQRTIALGVPPERVTTILNGCDGTVFRPGDRDEARRRLAIDLSGELIVYAGALLPTKGLAELTEAFIGLAGIRPNLRLALIGEGVFGERLKARAAKAGVQNRLLTPGRQESAGVASWMRACDVFCLPSYSEGCPNVVIEALSCGRPVVATDVGGIPELVKESSGILIPARDHEKLRAALDRALSMTWDTDRAAATFQRDWEQVAEETFAVCRRVLESARGRS